MLGKRTRTALGLCCVALTLSATSSTLAFCRSSSCQFGEEARVLAGGPECQRDTEECVIEGNPLHWGNPCLYYAVQEGGSQALGLTAEEFRVAIDAAFESWRGVTCPGGGSPRFRAQFQGFVECARREAVCGDQTANVSTFMLSDRDFPADGSVLGLTTPSGGTRSGLVIDADLELNSRDYRFAFAEQSGDFALADVLTHEVGHFLGLDHTLSFGALMAEDYASLALSRELLTDDDVAGICSIFPPGPPLDCAPPTAPAYDACQVDPSSPQQCQLSSMTHDDKSGGCQLSAPTTRAHSVWPMAALILWALRRRRSSPFATTQTLEIPS